MINGVSARAGRTSTSSLSNECSPASKSEPAQAAQPQSRGMDRFSDSFEAAPARSPVDLSGGAAPPRMETGSDLTAGLTDDPNIQSALDQLASTQDGATLLQSARAQGLEHIGVDPNQSSNAYTSGDNRSIYLSDPTQSDTVSTLGHELGHAALNSVHEGNAQEEEQAVDQLGMSIAHELGLDPGVPIDPDTQYAHLQETNDAYERLRGLGITGV